ncbi:MAG: ATP-binding protein, partial [Gammaproteobacteria bacterium]|nr:ATP-binding protein [Gammaproteobacteria bacterium]
QGFVGRQESIQQALALATSTEPGQAIWGLGITGKPGSGKSALFSQLNRQLNAQNILVLAHAAGISPSSTQVDQMLRRWIDELAQVLNIQDPIPDDAKPDDIDEIFRSLLSQVSTRQRVVVLIDALNQFERTNRAKHLTWLPKFWPDNARLITTAIPGSETEALFERDGINQYELPLLDESNARDIATHICDRYHRKLNPEVLELLLEKQTRDNQPSYGNPLWLNMAVEEINLLDADDFARAEQQFTGSAEEKLHLLIVSTAKEMPSSVTRLYGWMLDRAEDLFGEGWVQAFVNLITVSRNGWREKDFEVLIPVLTDKPWDNLTFAALRRTFRSHITQKGAEAQWDFTHAQMRIAVEHRNLTNKDTVKALHRNLSDYLLNLESEDVLHESETMFHLYQADDKERAAKYYGSELSEAETQGATQVLAVEILNGEGSSSNPGLEWTGSLVKLDDLGSDS